LRLLDEKGRLFGKISIIDLMVVAVILGVLVWFGYAKFGRDLGEDVASREQPIEITVIITGIRPTTAQAIEESTSFFEFKTGAKIGELVSVTTEPSDVWEILDDGRWIKMHDPDRVDAYVTIRGNARIGEDTITMNGVEARVGTSIGLKSKMAQVQGHIFTMNLDPEVSP
jgi:hypothetical protein